MIALARCTDHGWNAVLLTEDEREVWACTHHHALPLWAFACGRFEHRARTEHRARQRAAEGHQAELADRLAERRAEADL